MADPLLANVFQGRAFISDDVLDKVPGIIVFAHEGGSAYGHSCESNLIDPRRDSFFQPFHDYLRMARAEGYAVVDISVAPHRWALKQTQTGHAEELGHINDLMIMLWDSFLCLAEAPAVFFVSSGLPSYSICNLLDRRVVQDRVRGIAVLSPTLYLPVASAERSEWYAGNSLVLVPTKRERGTAIPTNESFGRCYSLGSEDPREIPALIAEHQGRVFDFILDRTPPAAPHERLLS